jgi:ADP-ribose pyrophosphatase YjhB (NUDIX family)
MSNPKWLAWAREMQSIAQSGITYSQNPYDIERYEQLRELAAEILSTYTETDLPIVRNLFESQSGYTTPKMDVRGVVFRGDEILLVKELADGGWTLPGGWVDVNESPSAAAERETFEETGYRVRAFKLLALFDRDHPSHEHPPYAFHSYKMFFACELLGGEPVDSIETAGAAFFAENAIPSLSVMRTSMEEIRRLYGHHREPNRPTDFD